MSFQEAAILLPCHSLEDFPEYHEGPAADGLLAAWTAIWHPAITAQTGTAPRWHRADNPPESVSGKLLVVPGVSDSMLSAGWADRAREQGATVVVGESARDAIVAAALADSNHEGESLASARAGDFHALGYCYLQLQLLTRHMRYMSNLDEHRFEGQLVAASRAAALGDDEQVQAHLQKCFDLLSDARDRFYSVDAYLIDLTLVAASTFGERLRGELASGVPTNVVLSGETLNRLAAEDPATLGALKAALAVESAALVGGEASERETPLLPIETILDELRRGAAIYERHLGQRAVVYGRRRFGLSPLLPPILHRLGFAGALHATLDDGRFPKGEHSTTRWEGFDSSAIDAITKIPLDAGRPETFLRLADRMAASMDRDHVATLVLAHWPGRSSPWYDDLRRCARFAPVLGRFATVTDYFRHTDTAGRISRYEADEYQSPYLEQATAAGSPDPISRLVRQHRRRAALDALTGLATMLAMLDGAPGDSMGDLVDEVAGHDSTEPGASPAELDDRLTRAIDSQTRRLATLLVMNSAKGAAGYVAINPTSGGRTMVVDTGVMSGQGSGVSTRPRHGASTFVVDVPSMGFAWTPLVRPAERRRRAKPIADGHTLLTNQFELSVDPATGGIRAIHARGSRGNRLSQQIAIRLPGPAPKPGDLWRDPDSVATYSTMVADSVEVVAAGPPIGAIQSSGRLLDADGQTLAGFIQTIEARLPSRVIRLAIELNLEAPPSIPSPLRGEERVRGESHPAGNDISQKRDPWNDYCAARFAWADPDDELSRSVGGCSRPTRARRIEAPHFVEIRGERSRTTILSAGLPYHRRSGERTLDTLLIVRGETQRQFELAIGIDIRHSMQAAIDLLSPMLCVPATAPGPTQSTSAWMFHIDLPSVVSTHWEPIGAAALVIGFRCRLLETAGRAGRIRLRAFRALASARQVDFQGQTIVAVPIEAEDTALVDVTACEWLELECYWRQPIGRDAQATLD